MKTDYDEQLRELRKQRGLSSSTPRSPADDAIIEITKARFLFETRSERERKERS